MIRLNRRPMLTSLLLMALIIPNATAKAATQPVPGAGTTSLATAAAPPGTTACPALLDHRFTRLRDGQPESLCNYSGRVLLVVNTASKCGFTPQYKGLQTLHEKYNSRGLTILAFPSADFLGQEHNDRAEIAKTCFDQYGAQFMVYDRTSVKGRDANPLFAELKKTRGAPGWNFHKYLIGRDGKPGEAFGSTTDPLDSKLTQEIEHLLATGTAKAAALTTR